MEEVWYWKTLRAAISQSFDPETLPDLVKTAGSVNQMVGILHIPSFPLPASRFPLKAMRLCSLQNLDSLSNFWLSVKSKQRKTTECGQVYSPALHHKSIINTLSLLAC